MPESACTIPPEILCRILDFVKSKSTFFNWTLCSSQFYEIGVPYLYRHIDLCDKEDGHAWWYGFPHLRSLASLLLRRPDLARLVRHFSMREAFDDGNNPHQCSCDPCPRYERLKDHEVVEVDEVFRGAIKTSSCSREEERQWLEHISWKGYVDALMTLLLPALTRLETLDLTLFYNIPYFERMLRRVGLKQTPFDTNIPFQHLREVTHAWPWIDNHCGLSPKYCAMFQQLPAVRSIFGHGIGSGQFAEHNSRSAMPSLDGASSPLEHLELRESRLPMPSLTQLLRAPKALLTFIYEIGRADLTTWGISFKGIIKALEPQEGSLENLWLDHEHTRHRGSRRPTHTGLTFGHDDLDPILSVSKFQNLKVLRIATLFLFGYTRESGTRGLTEVLPSTLEILHISHCEFCLSDVTLVSKDLLFQKKTFVPRLHHILLHGPTEEFVFYSANLVNLASAATTEGVSLIVVDDGRGVHMKEFGEEGWGLHDLTRWVAGMDESDRFPIVQTFDIQKLECR